MKRSQLVFTPILGRLSDKYGRRPILFFSLLGTSAGFLVLGFAKTLWMLFAGRIIDGVTGGNISTAQAYIADVTAKEDRAKGMGLIGAAFGLGFTFGPAIGGILSKWGISVPFVFAGLLALANAVLIYFLFVVAFSIMTASYALFTMHRFGFDAAHNGYFFMFVGIIGALIQGGLIGRLAKKFGEPLLAIVGALLFAFSLLAIPFTTPQQGL